MAIKLQIRRDTLTNWNANSSVVLLEGEIGYVTDTRNMKIGDGTTIWSSLKYQAPYYTGTNSSLAITTLSVDQTNNRVGIGNSSPASTLDVTGQVRVRGTTAYSAPADNVAAINYDSTSGVMTVDARSNAGSTVIAVHTSNATAGAERLRISSAGNVGIGATNPSNLVHLKGASPVIRLEDTDGADSNLYCLIDADNVNGTLKLGANNGNVVAQQNNAFVGINVNGTERFRANSTGVQITGTTTSSGALTVTTGGLTVTAGGATVTAGGLTVNAGTVSLPANSVSLGTVSQIAAGNFIGNSTGSTANIAAVTQAQARTMLGLIAASYTNPVTSNAVWTNTALSGSTTVNLDLDVTTLGIGVINRIPISLGRSGGSGNASVFCRAIVEAGETLLIIGGFDAGSAGVFNGGTGTGIAWYWRNEVWISAAVVANDSQQVRSVPTYAYTGANTVNVLKWNQITLTAPQVTAEVIAIRLS